MEELLKTFTIPDNTKMEEHSIVVDGDVIIGNHSNLGFGVIADSIIAGERVKINGNVIGTLDVRIDMWSHVGGDVRTKQEAYIGEYVNIDGKLIVDGDLDIGKDVKIKGGFEARGWIVVRNPIPVIIYVFLYLTELLRMGKDEEVEKALEEIFSDDNEDLNQDHLLIIPSGSRINLDSIKVPEKGFIGSNCRLMGNIRAASIIMDDYNTLFGSIKTENGIVIGEGNTIHGDLVTRGEVRINKGTHVLGEINGGKIFIHEEARVDGAMRAPGGVIISGDVFQEEIKEGSILDMAQQKIAPGSASKVSAKKPAASKVAYNISRHRMTTAVRIPDLLPSPEKKVPARQTTRKTPATKTTAKKTTTKKKATGAKKTATKKTATKKKATSKSATEKTAVDKTTRTAVPKKNQTAKKATNKTTTKKTTAKKTTAKKTTTKKKTVKKTTSDKTSASEK